MTFRFSSKPSTAANGPEFSVPAIGCVGIKRACAGCVDRGIHDAFFGRTHIDHRSPILAMVQRVAHDLHRGVHRNGYHHHIALPGDLLGRSYDVDISCLQGLLLVLLPLVASQHPAAKPVFFSPMASEQPINPRPITPTVVPCVFIWSRCVYRSLVCPIPPPGATPPRATHRK